MENGIGNLAEEKAVIDSLPTNDEPIVTDEKELDSVELIDPITKSEDEKTLEETIYEESLKSEENKTTETEDPTEFDVPEPTIEEKENEIESIAEDIRDGIDGAAELTQETIEKIATMYREKEEDYKRQIKELSISLSKAEKANERYLDEINDLKYDTSRVKVDDEDVGYYLNIRKKFAKNPGDKQIQKELARYHMSGLKTLYPEFDPVEVSRNISEKRLKTIEALTSRAENNAGIKSPEAAKAKPKGFALNM